MNIEPQLNIKDKNIKQQKQQKQTSTDNSFISELNSIKEISKNDIKNEPQPENESEQLNKADKANEIEKPDDTKQIEKHNNSEKVSPIEEEINIVSANEVNLELPAEGIISPIKVAEVQDCTETIDIIDKNPSLEMQNNLTNGTDTDLKKEHINIADEQIPAQKEVNNEFIPQQKEDIIKPLPEENKPVQENNKDKSIEIQTNPMDIKEQIAKPEVILTEDTKEIIIKETPQQERNVTTKEQVTEEIIKEDPNDLTDKNNIEIQPVKDLEEEPNNTTDQSIHVKNDNVKDNIKQPQEKEKSIKTNTKDNNKDNTQPDEFEVNTAVHNLQGIVDEINKLNQKDDIKEDKLKRNKKTDDRIRKSEDSGLIDNNMNIQEPKDKINMQMGTNMQFNSDGQPFAEFVNPKQEKEVLKSSKKDIAEEKAILSTMEENVAIANKNMLLAEEKSTEPKVKTVTNEQGIKKVNSKTNITVDTIVKYDNVIMDKSDVEFFANLVNNGSINLNDIQNADKSSQVSKTLADLLAKAMENNKPIRIDFDNNISVIIKIDRAGKISADFLPSSQVAENYLKENLPLLKQRFDDNNIDYNELNQRKQKQDQENRKKGRRDE